MPKYPIYLNVICVGGPAQGKLFDVGSDGMPIMGTRYGLGRLHETQSDGSIKELFYLAPSDWTTFDVMDHLIRAYAP